MKNYACRILVFLVAVGAAVLAVVFFPQAKEVFSHRAPDTRVVDNVYWGMAPSEIASLSKIEFKSTPLNTHFDFALLSRLPDLRFCQLPEFRGHVKIMEASVLPLPQSAPVRMRLYFYDERLFLAGFEMTESDGSLSWEKLSTKFATEISDRFGGVRVAGDDSVEIQSGRTAGALMRFAYDAEKDGPRVPYGALKDHPVFIRPHLTLIRYVIYNREGAEAMGSRYLSSPFI